MIGAVLCPGFSPKSLTSIYYAISLNGTAINLYSGIVYPHHVHLEITFALILIPSPNLGALDLKFHKSFDI